MRIDRLKLAYFSPTGTTRSIVKAIANGINQDTAEQIDITKPNMRKSPSQTSKNDLLVVAVPVYTVARMLFLVIDEERGGDGLSTGNETPNMAL